MNPLRRGTDTTEKPMSKSDRAKLVESLMRTCYKVEVLAGKCQKAGLQENCLDIAAARLRYAAQKVDRL